MKRIFLLSLFFVLMFVYGHAKELYIPHEGDIIFQTSRSSQSLAIQTATNSKYSHMGIVFFKKGKPFVYEAASKVKFTPLKTWIAQGENGKFVAKRLKNQELLTPEALNKLYKIAKIFEGNSYDLIFNWSDEEIYCSELVWKIYDRALDLQIGELQKIKDFNLTSSAVKQKLKERYGENIPMEEVVVSPVSMFNSFLLIEVAKK